jgi:hypothetical protein
MRAVEHPRWLGINLRGALTLCGPGSAAAPAPSIDGGAVGGRAELSAIELALDAADQELEAEIAHIDMRLP